MGFFGFFTVSATSYYLAAIHKLHAVAGDNANFIVGNHNLHHAYPKANNLNFVYLRDKQAILERILGRNSTPSQNDENEMKRLGEFLNARGKNFQYHDPVEIVSVDPSSSPTAGNVSVAIFGGPFLSSSRPGDLFCKFGRVSVPGQFVSSSQIQCNTPPHAAGSYPLEVTQNGQDYTQSGSVFRFYHECSIRSISPVTGPAIMGGTNVRILGEGFIDSTALYCRFGEVVVPATFVDSSELYCSAPSIKEQSMSWLVLPEQRHNETILEDQVLLPMSHHYPKYLARLVDVEVTNNGQDYTSSGFKFLYQKDIQVIELSRASGPSHGGTPVFITGSSFVNSTRLTCKFGDQTAEAIFLTREAILCTSPPIPLRAFHNSHEQTVIIYVSNNAVDYSVGGHFKYSHSLPSGTYQPGAEGVDTLLRCPRGAYCTSYSFRNFTLCTPGTYQPLVGQSQCILCPIGYVCAEFGMAVPRICPAGYVCDDTGMYEGKPCPAGHWCDKGTATLSSACLNRGIFDASYSSLDTCFDNSTDDFGLQASKLPAQVWAERHLMPLDSDSTIQPIRGKFCLEESCLKYEDENDFGVFDKSFDYSSTGFALRRPHPCPPGVYCHPGTPTNVTISTGGTTPFQCRDGVHCPEGSASPHGIGSCKRGHYCRFGIRKPCPVGTYCPNEYTFEPFPCEPGTFNLMIGQSECSICPVGYMCPSYGLRDPVICPPGLVCSRRGLASPNIRCPAGFYCPNGTQTSDPFRNDTTLRPYACTPGTYCLAGTGSNEVLEGVVGYAQLCAKGFFCEAASVSAKGSGPCPPGFICEKGTANPRPTPKGFFAEHSGTIEATACLPGFYAPTIENKECYPCPPGTSCSFEGLFEAEECPPGTYRSDPEIDGFGSCIPCPQGTWSKNWQLREKGECTRCPTGVVCPLDGMTTPCSFDDLPKPFEPVVNFKGMPAFEYEFPIETMPQSFTLDECLALNSKSKPTNRQEFFYGELIPPYIDILGRGPHFRQTDDSSIKYQSTAKCYRNSQPDGSLLYMRMADYYGPQYDIQTGFFHQGYGSSLLLNQMYAVSPPKGFDIRLTYFRGEGNGFIDLPKSRRFETAFNCTKGFKLYNSTLVRNDVKRVVYTHPVHDYEGGYDIEKCPTFDQELNCYVDITFELHQPGECCHVEKFRQRAILLASDQFYHGTCEADKICSEGRSSEPEAKPCDDSFICDEGTSLENSLTYPCPAGFICGFGTTPDTQLEAPSGQLRHLCDEGRYCNRMLSGIGNEVCPGDYFCPTGTADPFEGRFANDGLLRMLPSPLSDEKIHLRYLHGENFVLYSDHDMKCAASTMTSLKKRFQTGWKHPDELDSNLEYLARQQKPFPISINEATQFEETCERDKKSHFIQQAIHRNDCNCHSKFFFLAAIYRLWKCTSTNPLDDLGLGEATVPSMGNGRRDFWYSDSRVHLDRKSATTMDPSTEPFGLNWGEGKVCKFPPSNNKITLTQGRIPHAQDSPIHARGIPSESKGYLEFEDVAESKNEVDVKFPIRFTWQSLRVFANYFELKTSAVDEYKRERDAVAAGKRSDIDPFVFNIFKSIQLIEQYGEKLEQFAFLELTNASSSLSIELSFVDAKNSSALYSLAGRLDWCECENLLKCPNGTTTSGVGAKGMNDCVSTKEEVLHRISLIPPPPDETIETMSTGEGSIGTDTSRLELKPFETGILTIDLSMLPNNFTYNDHYRISIYDGCQPCPLRYKCNANRDYLSRTCSYPPLERRYELLNRCLKENRKMVCLHDDGTHENIQKCYSGTNNTGFAGSSRNLLLFSEPDLEKCLSRPYFCADTEWNYRTYRRLCQGDSTVTGEAEVYDCSLVHRWNTYSQWKNNVCCSEIPELHGIDSCQKNECINDPRIEDIIRGKLIKVFEREYGFIPPIRKPSGKLLMNATLQEALDHESPLDLFHEWQNQFPQTSKLMQEVKLHNPKKPQLSNPYKKTSGCCGCKRHPMPTFFETNNPISSGYPDNKHGHVQITVTAIAPVELYIAVELLHGEYYLDFDKYFGSRDKTSLRIHAPQKFSENSEHATWLTVLEKSAFDKWDLELPLNLPISVNEEGKKNIEDRFFVNTPSNKTIGNHLLANEDLLDIVEHDDDGKSRSSLPSVRDPIESIRENVEWWGQKHDFIALPYIPFFSNCDGYDSQLFLGRLLEDHPDCLSVPLNEVESTNQFSFTRDDPYSDRCQDLILQCTYEEEIRESREKYRWFELSSGSTLFYITRDAVTVDVFVPSNEAEDWGRTMLLDQLRNSYDLIPVSIGNEMGGFFNAIPRVVELELKYFQISSGTKRLVEATIYFDHLCTTQKQEYFGGSTKILDIMKERGILPCESDINGDIKSDNYDLIIQYYPLGWFDLLNRFEFGGPVYFFFYTAIGLTICSIGGSVYGINRLLTKFRYPPRFHGWQLVALVSRPQIEGVTLAVIPYMVVISTIYSLFRHDGLLDFHSLHKNWMSSGLVGDDERVENAMGRMGSAFLVLGSYITLRGSRSIIINDENSKHGHVVAKRAHFIWASLCLQAMILCLLEFSYSDSYKNDIYRFVVMFKFVQIAFDVVLSHLIRDKLLIAPLLVLMQMSEILVTIGARDFVEFTLSFLVKISLIVIQRLFIYPFIHTILTLLPRWNMLVRHSFGKKGLTRQEKKQREARWKKINENIELQTEGVEPLVDSITIYSVEKTGGILIPFMCLFLMLVYRETEIAMNYNINQHELLYYCTFAFYMIIWTCFVDAFVLSSQELLYGWRVYDYLSYTRWRFSNRENRWSLFGQFDESLSDQFQSIDLLCFSSQYYFILTLLTLGFGSNIFAITIFLRRKYNFLADPVFPIIASGVVLCCEGMALVCKYFANASVPAICWRGIWQVSLIQSTMDDVIAAKLAVGEGRQEDLEQERQELLALNSETFRHNFVEKNRPWILQHLAELITPRTLQGEGPDERPLADYLRDVYSNLMNTSVATKRIGDRSDISSDSSDDEFENRRQWDRTPLEGNQLEIAKVWLQKARKRGIFAKAVKPSIERRKEDQCSACSRTVGSCKILHAGLGKNGSFDPYAIDGLIKEFEQNYSPQESDPVLWKAFFRERAQFMTICNICLDQIEQQKLHKDVRHVGAGRPTRPGDISSDDDSDEEDDFPFEPIAVPRSSNEGAMMSKWLQACRQRLGGDFPRNGSQQSTERYLSALRARKLRKTRTVRKDNPVQGWGSVSTSLEGKKIMTKWLNDARIRSKQRFALKGNEIRKSLENVLREMSVESDWYFGDLRLEGKALLHEGNHLMKEKESKEKAIERDVTSLRHTLSNLTSDLETKRRSKQSDYNEKIAKLRNESQRRKDERVRELNKALHESSSDETSASLREQIRSDIEKEEKATAKNEEEMKADLEKLLILIDRDIAQAKRKFDIDSESIRERLIRDWKREEVLYRQICSVWIGISSRKVEQFKQRRDEDKR